MICLNWKRVGSSFLVGTLVIASQVQADTATSELDAVAGLAPVLTLECTEVNLGVWRVPVRSGGVTTVTLDAVTGDHLLDGETSGVSVSAGYEPSRGVCTISGSAAADGANATFSLSGHANMPMIGDADVFGGALGAGDGSGFQATLTQASPTCSISAGGCQLYLGGILTIPGDISAEHYGGYRTASPATVTVNDAVSAL